MSVALVGAGPGDPGLLTLRGAELLRSAEVVLYDRLIGHALLDLAPADAELIDVGKGSGQSERQADINELLVAHGRSGRRVVRLKGGDPFVFGRGGEEAEVLRRAGIAVEVVPGVTSALAAPAAAGIPVTHRTVSTSVTVVTGHAAGPGMPGVDWASLARAGGTLVILMGMGRRPLIVQELLAAGRPLDEPVAVVRWGTTDEQEVVRTTLAGLPDVDLGPPATIVIGPVAGLDVLAGLDGPAGSDGTGESDAGGPG